MASRRLTLVVTIAIIAGAGLLAGLFLLKGSGGRAAGRPGDHSEIATTISPLSTTNASVNTRSPGRPVASPPDSLSILFLGDIMLDRNVTGRMKKANDPLYPFANIRDEQGQYFHGQDLVVANLEGPVTAVRRPPVKTIDFAFDPSVVQALKAVGINAVSQANNHTLDQGRAGADDSRRNLSDAGVAAFGDEVRDDLASSLSVVTVRGERIALLGFNITDHSMDRVAVAKDIEEAKATSSRVIVMMHWGTEYTAAPNTSQTELAHWFIDQDVDAVIGGHPHWMESVEVYKNHPIVYSLGNFVFDQDWSVETQFGLAVKLVFSEASSTELQLLPVSIVKSQPHFLTGTERDARLNRLASISDSSLALQIKEGKIEIP
jgi:poly-gamma-glutamate synthesis protein (capsule biosynthesis protein)